MGRYRNNYTLFKRGKYWYYQTYDIEGVRTTAKTTGCKLKSEAKIYCDNLYKSGSLWNSSKLFSDYAGHFFDDNSTYLMDRIEPLSYHTLSSYRSALKKYLLPYFGDKKLCEINYSTLKQFRTKLLQEEVKAKSINAYMTILKIIISTACKDNLITESPFKFIKPFKNTSKGRDSYTLEEVKLLIRELPQQYKNVTVILALTGLRRQEAAGLMKEDVKQGNGYLYIDLNKQIVRGNYTSLKTKKERTIPIIPELVDLIDCSTIGYHQYANELAKVRDRIPDGEQRLLCMHSLRHFFITNAKAYGVNPLIVETIAGHSLKGIVQTYTNFKTDDLTDILSWQKETLQKLLEN